jgi:hypothetical protein
MGEQMKPNQTELERWAHLRFEGLEMRALQMALSIPNRTLKQDMVDIYVDDRGASIKTGQCHVSCEHMAKLQEIACALDEIYKQMSFPHEDDEPN